MLAYESKAVSPHACGPSRGCERSVPASRAGRTGTWHTGEGARTARLVSGPDPAF